MLLVTLLFLMPSIHALIGYDCGGRHLNITSISLLDSGECSFDIKTTHSTQTFIQLLQLSDYKYAEVIQCKAEVLRTVYYCGMHSHLAAVRHGQASYIEHMVYEECDRMHKDGLWELGEEKVSGLAPNSTTMKSITLAGKIEPNGKCQGISYNDAYGSWDSVIVQASVKITLKSGYVPVHLASGKIHLKSGATCDLKDGHCLDPEDGYTFWRPMPITSCDFHQYDVLYEGLANKTTSEVQGPLTPLVYSLETQDITFALATTTKFPLCGYYLMKTEHPRLFILETHKANTPKNKGDIPVNNLDIFTYVNSKFVYVEKHIRAQMTSLYHNVIEHRCKLEKEIITNALSLATLLPDEFAYRLAKGPGYMAVAAGEVIHVIKCIPVEVTVRKTKECYTELPVNSRNVSLFITPKSRILTKVGTQKECSKELPTLYRIEDTWIELSPEARLHPTQPQQLKPLTKITWKYLTPGPLAVSGVYSQQDIDKLRDHIMFPAEKPAVLNSLARGITGYKTGGPGSMYDLLDEESLNKIAENTARKIWSGFVTFGSATAGVFGIFLIIRLIKIIIDTTIHGYALHMAYGCSLHLIGAIWSSLAHLLLHLAHRSPREQRNNDDSSGLPPVEHAPTSPHAEIIIEQPQGRINYLPNPMRLTKTQPNLSTIDEEKDAFVERPLYRTLSERLSNIE